MSFVLSFSFIELGKKTLISAIMKYFEWKLTTIKKKKKSLLFSYSTLPFSILLEIHYATVFTVFIPNYFSSTSNSYLSINDQSPVDLFISNNWKYRWSTWCGKHFFTMLVYFQYISKGYLVYVEWNDFVWIFIM